MWKFGNFNLLYTFMKSRILERPISFLSFFLRRQKKQKQKSKGEKSKNNQAEIRFLFVIGVDFNSLCVYFCVCFLIRLDSFIWCFVTPLIFCLFVNPISSFSLFLYLYFFHNLLKIIFKVF